jgi:hypothetical protein
MKGRLKGRFPILYIVVVIGGTTAGAILGRHIFPEADTIFGSPLTDIIFAILGGLFASVGWEILANVRDSS